jgi:soluble lytic murein transglycosylase-like protein
MRNLKGTYVHRGDAARRRARLRRAGLAIGFFGAMALLIESRSTQVALADGVPQSSAFSFGRNSEEIRQLRSELDAARGELDIANALVQRAELIFRYSSEYRIAANMAEVIHDVAVSEGIDPDLAFRLVRVESNFNPRAVSPVGALGLAQLMPATARYFKPGVTREELFDPATNVRIGLRYLRALLNENQGDLRTALLVYNRGPVAVRKAIREGMDPANGYETLVTRGYVGNGLLE